MQSTLLLSVALVCVGCQTNSANIGSALADSDPSYTTLEKIITFHDQVPALRLNNDWRIEFKYISGNAKIYIIEIAKLHGYTVGGDSDSIVMTKPIQKNGLSLISTITINTGPVGEFNSSVTMKLSNRKE